MLPFREMNFIFRPIGVNSNTKKNIHKIKNLLFTISHRADSEYEDETTLYCFNQMRVRGLVKSLRPSPRLTLGLGIGNSLSRSSL